MRKTNPGNGLEKEVKRQTAQSKMKIGFGKNTKITCESIYKECEWVSRMETPTKAIIEFQEFIEMSEEWEDECREPKRRN